MAVEVENVSLLLLESGAFGIVSSLETLFRLEGDFDFPGERLLFGDRFPLVGDENPSSKTFPLTS